MLSKSSTGIESLEGVRAVLFDLDGTLWDTDDLTVENLSRRLAWLGLKNSTERARRLVMVLESPLNTLMTLLDLCGMDGPIHRLMSFGRRRMSGSTPPFRTVPGVEEMLRTLHGRYSLALVTTRSRKDATAFLETFALTGLFDAVVTRESTWRIKPHPAPIRRAAESLGLPVEHCLMVGDTTPDIKAALAAGARAVGVLCGFGTREELEKAGALGVVETTADLLSGLVKV